MQQQGMTIPIMAVEFARHRMPPTYMPRATTMAEIFDADTACSAGYFDAVVSPEALEAEAMASGARLAKLKNPGEFSYIWSQSRVSVPIADADSSTWPQGFTRASSTSAPRLRRRSGTPCISMRRAWAARRRSCEHSRRGIGMEPAAAVRGGGGGGGGGGGSGGRRVCGSVACVGRRRTDGSGAGGAQLCRVAVAGTPPLRRTTGGARARAGSTVVQGEGGSGRRGRGRRRAAAVPSAESVSGARLGVGRAEGEAVRCEAEY